MMVHWIDNEWLHGAIWGTATAILVLQTARNSVLLFQLLKALPRFLRARNRASRLCEWWLLTSKAAPPMTLLMPAYNEETTIVESLRSTLTLRYPEYEIIVVNDGSKDQTLARLIDAFALQPVHRALPGRTDYQPVRGIYACAAVPNLLVVDKQNGGKADALNAAIDLAAHPYVCTVDAGTVLDSDALLRAVRPFVDAPDTTLAVGGTIRVVNGCQVRSGQVLKVRPPKHWLELFQSVEYLCAFLLARTAWTSDQAVTPIPGAFGIFRREVLLELGGYAHGVVDEDMELVVRLHRWAGDTRAPSEVWHMPDPVCWKEVPDSLPVLSRQRTRWQRGLCETLWKHRDMLCRPRYGSVGLHALPSLLIFDVITPVLELVGLVLVPLGTLTGILSVEFLIAYFAVVFGFGLCLSLGAMILAEFSQQHHRRVRDLFWMGIGAIMENFGYRQLNSWWRVQGMWQFLRKKHDWSAMPREGNLG